MMIGVVKFFDAQKNYGFITAHEGKEEVFFHASEMDGIASLTAGQWVQFEVVPDYRHPNGKLKAMRVAACGPKRVRSYGTD